MTSKKNSPSRKITADLKRVRSDKDLRQFTDIVNEMASLKE